MTVRLPAVARRPELAAAGGWLAVYGAVYATGARFSTAYVEAGWQLLPAEALRDDPLRSLWYLHIQPPLWNAVIGVVLRWSPLPEALSLQLLMMVLGAALAATVAGLLGALGVRPAPAVAVALYATANRDVIEYALMPQYELAVALGLTAIVWTVAARRPAAWRFTVVALVGTAVVLTRSLYHPLWLATLLVGLAVVWRRRLPWRRALAAAAVPALLAGGWMVKNEVVFGQATMSSWSGMNLLRSVQPTAPPGALERLYASGAISAVGVVPSFSQLAAYADIEPCARRYDHPAVALSLKPDTSGTIGGAVANFNDECLLPIYEQAGRDAVAVVTAEPGAWMRGRWFSARLWFDGVEGVDVGGGSGVRALRRATELARVEVPITLDLTSWGRPLWSERWDVHVSVVELAAMIFVGGRATQLLWRHRPRRDPRPATAAGDRIALAVVVGTGIVVWTFVAGVVLELGEQARFRMPVTPLLMAIAAAELFRVTPLARRALRS